MAPGRTLTQARPLLIYRSRLHVGFLSRYSPPPFPLFGGFGGFSPAGNPHSVFPRFVCLAFLALASFFRARFFACKLLPALRFPSLRLHHPHSRPYFLLERHFDHPYPTLDFFFVSRVHNFTVPILAFLYSAPSAFCDLLSSIPKP